VTVSPVTAATGAEGRPCASSQTICPWLRATGSWARRSWVASASTPRDAWTESHFGMPSLYMRIWYHLIRKGITLWHPQEFKAHDLRRSSFRL
jgi:hypothetical protein